MILHNEELYVAAVEAAGFMDRLGMEGPFPTQAIISFKSCKSRAFQGALLVSWGDRLAWPVGSRLIMTLDEKEAEE